MADSDEAEISGGETEPSLKEESSTVSEETVGCEHYKRKCAFVSPCCNKIYTCRVCHDDAENHQIQRKAVRELKCLKCAECQPVSGSCRKCNIQFGKYYCDVCNLFDDQDKKQFHCAACGICRVGGRENFFHCVKCDMCLHVGLRESHKCVENASKSNCPVCLELLHTSRESVCMPKCGHPIHQICMDGMLRTGNYACPTCAQSLVNMKGVWEHLDEEIAVTPMPDEYKNYHVQVLCRDCHQESRVLFHVLGLKCVVCGSYNTCRAREPEGNPNREEGAQTDETAAASEGMTSSQTAVGTGEESPLEADMEVLNHSDIGAADSEAAHWSNQDSTDHSNNKH